MELSDEDVAYSNGINNSSFGYNFMFKYNRAPPGGVIDTIEISRRLAYELQIPNRFGKQIAKAILRVLSDAAAHGEGIRFDNYATIKFKKFSSDYVRLPDGSNILRPSVYKPSIQPHDKLKQSLIKLTKSEAINSNKGI